MMLDELKRCVERSPVVKMGEYEYSVSPVTDGIPLMEPRVLQEITERIVEVADLDCDVIVAPEAMGIPIAVALSIRTGIPYNIIRKRRYGLPGETSICQVTGYSRCDMYINGLKKRDRVVLVDDIISTGGTLNAVLEALDQMGVKVVDVVVVLERGDRKASIERRWGHRIRTLMKIDVQEGTVVVTVNPDGGSGDEPPRPSGKT